MPRNMIDLPDLELDSSALVETFAFDVVTPLAGHTALNAPERRAEDGQPGLLIRQASVKNLIRHWWRVCYGFEHATPAALFEAENSIFGGPSVPGLVSVRTRTTSRGQNVLFTHLPDAPKYATFPWTPTPTAQCCVGARFEVDVIFDSHVSMPIRLQVITAVSAWAHLGGIGQRTRRGMGSLKPTRGKIRGLPSILQGFRESARPKKCKTTGFPRQIFVDQDWDVNRRMPASKAWSEAVSVYQHFRQGRGFARDEGHGNRPGQSRFPEPDSIRRRMNATDHPLRIDVDGYPRSDLGLPIIFEFRGAGPRAPRKSELAIGADGMGRFASPIITKAWWNAAQGKFVPLVAILDAPRVWQAGHPIKLKKIEGPAQSWTIPGNELELSQPQLDVIVPLDGQHAREALAQFVSEENYGELR